jgi:hypothetical protein
MALTLETHTAESIGLEEYVEYISHNVEVRDLDSVSASAPQLAALSNNRTFLTEHINNELRDWRHFQLANSYTAQTLLLGLGKDFIVRANIWVPPARDIRTRDAQNQMFYYQIPHDHNFSFLTVGYLGSGYETAIYEYDSDCVSGILGEHVTLRFLERTSLPQGKIMLYRASKDVHYQEHPKEFSISLNLLLAFPEISLKNQFLFDLDSRTIREYVQSPGASRVMVCHIARYVGNGATVNLLEALSARHASERVRATAYESWSILEPGESDAIWRRALEDRHSYVRYCAERQLTGVNDAREH